MATFFRRTSPLLLTAFLLAGCQQVELALQRGPEPAEVPPIAHAGAEPQIKVQSLRHWQLLAEDLVALLQEREAPATLAVAEPAQDSPFHRAFIRLLTAELSANGFTVASGGNGAPVLAFDLHVLGHEPRVWVNRPGYVYYFGEGFARTREGDWQAAAASGRAPPENAAVEILLYATVRSDGELIFAQTQLAYVNPAQRGLYLARADESLPPADLTPITLESE